jgi:hypothetical protein
MNKKVIYIKDYLPSIIATRSAILDITSNISFQSEIHYIFDFSEVIFISRSFADEFYKHLIKYKIKWSLKNANKNVENMLKVVSKQKTNKLRECNFKEISFTSFKNTNELHQFLSSF